MSDYRVTITKTMDSCPFDAKRRSKAYCKVCESWNKPCAGIGVESTVLNKKVESKKMKQILNIVKND